MSIRGALSVVAVGVLSLTACGAATEDTAAPTASSQVKPAGELVIWTDPKRAAALVPFGAEYAAATGIEVRIEPVSSELPAAFLTASRAGSAPDVLVGPHDWIGNLIQDGAIDPVDLADPTQFSPSAVESVTYDGRTYGTPYALENLALICNTELIPTAPATVEDLVHAGQGLVDKGLAEQVLVQQVGQGGDAYHMQPLLASAGGALFGVESSGAADPTQVLIDSPHSIAAMEKIQSLGEDGAGALTRAIGAENSIATFTSGAAPCIITGPWAVPDIERSGIPYDIHPIPGFAGGQDAAPFVGTQVFYVAAGGRNKARAQEFVVDYVASPEAQVSLYEAEPRRPALLAAQASASSTDATLVKFEQAAVNGVPLPAIPQMEVVWEAVGKAQAAIVGGADPSTALTAAADQVRQQIDG